MSVNLSIKNVPDDLAEKLRQRARANHRSLQGELLALLQEAVAGAERLSPERLLDIVRDSGVATSRTAAQSLRAERDAR
jgi:antitoxin FitA